MLSMKVRDKTKTFFQHNYPELLPRLVELIEARTEYLYWTGPKIAIHQRSMQSCFFRQQRLNTATMKKKAPHRDFADQPLYPVPSNEIDLQDMSKQADPTDDQNEQKCHDSKITAPSPHPSSSEVNVRPKGTKAKKSLPSLSSSEDSRPRKRLRKRD